MRDAGDSGELHLHGHQPRNPSHRVSGELLGGGGGAEEVGGYEEERGGVKMV